MVKILQKNLKVTIKTHKKNTKKGATQYTYGSITIHDSRLLKYVGKKVRIEIQE